MMIPKCEWLHRSEIRERAESFLERQHPEGTLPVPIEEIIDVKLGIDIVPLTGLKRTFDWDGFLSNDRKSIHVEEYVVENYENRYRFTLAHELGHLVLHDYIYAACQIASIDDYRTFLECVGPRFRADMEWQANKFAGYLLMPTRPLVEQWRQVQSRLLQMAKEAEQRGFAREEYAEVLLEAAAEALSPPFAVSCEAMQRRLRDAVSDKAITLL